MRRGDWLIVAILIGLCAVVVVRHFEHGEEPAVLIEPIAIGEALDASLVLKDVGGRDRTLADWLGRKATVLYSWKVSCPCIDQCEPRLRMLYAQYGTSRGVTWIAVDGEPEDEREEILAKMGRLGPTFFRMLLDPDQALLARVGFGQAALVAVLDGDGRLRYRGSMDDDYLKPTRSYLAEALAAVVEGAPLALAETKPIYGCEFSRPPACFPPAVTAPAAPSPATSPASEPTEAGRAPAPAPAGAADTGG